MTCTLVVPVDQSGATFTSCVLVIPDDVGMLVSRGPAVYPEPREVVERGVEAYPASVEDCE